MLTPNQTQLLGEYNISCESITVKFIIGCQLNPIYQLLVYFFIKGTSKNVIA